LFNKHRSIQIVIHVKDLMKNCIVLGH